MKTETKHTPGPWHLNGHAVEWENPKPPRLTTVVAYVEDEHTSEWEANARVIAASVDLLEAAKEWIGIIEENQYDDIQPGPANRLRAAIEKAEGKEVA